jgi:hypothetical protein
MADQFYNDIPARANNIGTDIDQIELSLGYIKDMFQTIGTWHDSSLTGCMPGNRGMFNRCHFKWKDTDEIYLEPGNYHHAGSTGQMMYWDSQLTFQFGSGGSNSASNDLGASEWHYLYIDDSAVVTAATNLISNTELLNSTTAPAWTVANHGWYPSSATNNVQTTDRCIGAFLTDGSNNITYFKHVGDVVYFNTSVSIGTHTSSSSFTSKTCTAPGFCDAAECMFYSYTAGSLTFNVHWRPGDSTDATGLYLQNAYGYHVDDGNFVRPSSTLRIALDSSDQTFDIRHSSSSGDAKTDIYQSGWYFPVGM